MKVYTFNNDTAKITKRYKNTEAWAHIPSAELAFKKSPHIEVYLHQTPKNHTTAIRMSLKELRVLIKKAEKKRYSSR